MKKNWIWRRMLGMAIGVCMTAGAWGAAFAADEITVCPEESPLTVVSADDGENTSWTSSKLKAAQVDFTKVASASYDKLRLSWEPLSGVDGYQIYRATARSGKYAKIATVKGASSATYTDTGRTCGTRYYYKLRAYKKIGGKTVYSKYSTVLSAYAKPAKVKVTDAYAPSNSTVTIAVSFTTVRGATDYEAQINQIKRTARKPDSEATHTMRKGRKCTLETYKQCLAKMKKMYPSGYVTKTYMENGKVIEKKMTVEKFTETMVGKNQVETELVQDDSIYEFRVRAYRKVNGRKVYGAWSEPYTLKETLNLDEIFKELRQYMIDYAAKNEPRWHYDDQPHRSAVGSKLLFRRRVAGLFHLLEAGKSHRRI